MQSIVREELEAAKAEASPDAAEPEAESAEADTDRTLTAKWENGFVAETADEDFRIHLGGRMEFDNCWFNQDDNILIGPTEEQTMRDGTLMRRARFRADGRIAEYIAGERL